MTGKSRFAGTDPGILLRVSEHFLRRRHYADSRKYAQQALQIDPNFSGISEILAVADVLLAAEPTGTLTDWYGVLQINRFSEDSDLIRQRFNHLHVLLNPSNNNFPFAEEAFDLVSEAWNVLSNPLKKLEFDDAIKKLFDDGSSNGGCDLAFWTVCPYCYHVYEYPRVYLELCLRCPNEKCSMAFTCVEINRPPPEVLTEGKYFCAGFLPVGFQYGSWNPFAPLAKQKGNAGDDTGNFVEISDDEEVDAKSDKSFNGVHDGEKVEIGRQSVKSDSKRKKMVAKNAKKVTGTGNRVTKEGFRHDPTLDNDADDDSRHGSDFNPRFLGEAMNVGEVEFIDADDDILVSLQNGI